MYSFCSPQVWTSNTKAQDPHPTPPLSSKEEIKAIQFVGKLPIILLFILANINNNNNNIFSKISQVKFEEDKLFVDLTTTL